MFLRRLRHAFLIAMLAASSRAALASEPLGFADARLLLARTCFAASQTEVEAIAALTREQAVDRVLAWTRKDAATPPPPWVDAPFQSLRRLRFLSVEERKLFRRQQLEEAVELRAWWLEEMLTARAPLTEKMTLFWHNHFVSSQQKVRSAQLMYRQNVLLRQHALGNFAQLLHAIARDPAMVIYLDSASNRKGQPNENFARELMELFTLGEGHYTERDVKEAARAFTGWSIDFDTGEFLFRPRQHDDGPKTVLGHTGNFDGNDVLDILLKRPETAVLIVSKLWREFVSPHPDEREVARIAAVFRESGYDIRAAVRALLTSDAFYAAQNRGTLVKSPVDLVVGTLREFHFTMPETLPFVFVLAQLGQNLFAPPNVRGWPGGLTWLNSTTLLARQQFLARLLKTGSTPEAVPLPIAPNPGLRARILKDIEGTSVDYDRWLTQFSNMEPHSPGRLLLASAPAVPIPAGVRGRDLIRHIVQDPAYQLQ